MITCKSLTDRRYKGSVSSVNQLYIMSEDRINNIVIRLGRDVEMDMKIWGDNIKITITAHSRQGESVVDIVRVLDAILEKYGKKKQGRRGNRG